MITYESKTDKELVDDILGANVEAGRLIRARHHMLGQDPDVARQRRQTSAEIQRLNTFIKQRQSILADRGYKFDDGRVTPIGWKDAGNE